MRGFEKINFHPHCTADENCYGRANFRTYKVAHTRTPSNWNGKLPAIAAARWNIRARSRHRPVKFRYSHSNPLTKSAARPTTIHLFMALKCCEITKSDTNFSIPTLLTASENVTWHHFHAPRCRAN